MSAYKWQGRKYSVDANVVGRELEAMESENGSVTAEGMVNRARPKQSPLHPLFEWDNKKAAEMYRKQQAASILYSLTIVRDEIAEPVRAYVNVSPDADNPTRRTGTFVNTDAAFSNPESRSIVLRTAYRHLKEIERQYAMFTELAAVFEEIDKLDIP